MNLKLIKTLMLLAKFLFLPRKYSRADRGKNHKGVPRLLPQRFVKDLNQMLNTSIKNADNFIRISISSKKKSCSPPDFIFFYILPSSHRSY